MIYEVDPFCLETLHLHHQQDKICRMTKVTEVINFVNFKLWTLEEVKKMMTIMVTVAMQRST